MAANDERNRAEQLAWPPTDDGGFDVFELDRDRAAKAQTVDRPGADRPSRGDDVPPRAAVATDPPPAPVAQQPAGGRAARGQRDEPPHIAAAADRGHRKKWVAIPRAITGLRRPTRPAWLTLERAAIIALALVTLGEASYIGVRMIRSAGAPGASATANPGQLPPAPKAPTVQTPISGAVGTSGRLVVQTSPTGGGVSVDGRAVGTAPVSLDDVAAGEHTVVVHSRHGSLSQKVNIAVGRETEVLVPLAAAAAAEAPAPRARPQAADGWLSVDSPIEMRVFEGDQLIGTTGMARIALGPGRHALVFTNDAVGYRHAQNVLVAAGKATEVALDLPKQTVAINALPWADVWIDGAHVGETPIGRATVTVGRHTVVLRNPDLGERTVTTLVTANQPARISVDMRK